MLRLFVDMEADLLAQQTGKSFVGYGLVFHWPIFPKETQREPNIPASLLEDIKGRRKWLEQRVNRVRKRELAFVGLCAAKCSPFIYQVLYIAVQLEMVVETLSSMLAMTLRLTAVKGLIDVETDLSEAVVCISYPL